jgi:putative transcriptional regulator
MSKLMESLDVPSDGVTGDVQIRFGGPLETQAGFLMYSKKIENEDGICSSHGVTVSNNKDVLKTLGSENSPEEIILFFGYAGWSPNQLESELARKDWLTVPADRSFLFAPDIKSLWNRARARYGLDL